VLKWGNFVKRWENSYQGAWGHLGKDGNTRRKMGSSDVRRGNWHEGGIIRGKVGKVSR
jgi:hypothetical protein